MKKLFTIYELGFEVKANGITSISDLTSAVGNLVDVDPKQIFQTEDKAEALERLKNYKCAASKYHYVMSSIAGDVYYIEFGEYEEVDGELKLVGGCIDILKYAEWDTDIFDEDEEENEDDE